MCVTNVMLQLCIITSVIQQMLDWWAFLANDSDVIISGYFPIRLEPNERSAPEQGSALLANMADRSQKFLRDVRKCPGNDRCADCNRHGELMICCTGTHFSGICPNIVAAGRLIVSLADYKDVAIVNNANQTNGKFNRQSHTYIHTYILFSSYSRLKAC